MTAHDTPAMRRAIRDCLAQRGRWPTDGGTYLGEVSAVRFHSGHLFRIGEVYDRGDAYCMHGRYVVPHSFYMSRRRTVLIWCCWPLNRDERGRRTWDWLMGDSADRCVLNPP